MRKIVIGVLLTLALAASTLVAQRGAGPAAPAPSRTYPPTGNLAQLMRGIFFPNSNLIFSVQQRDPGAPATPAPNSPGNTASVFEWGMGIYTGWQVVDNAAIALADVSPLMLAPQLKCENGRPAPVTDPDWIKYTDEMIAVSQRIYKIAQTRNQDTVAEATGDLSDACANCHRAYRDVRGPGAAGNPPEPGANASRCLPRR